MALNYVTLTADLLDGQGNFLDGGGATFTPSAQLTDATDHEIVTKAPLPVAFKSTGSPTIKLLATDNASVTPPGWAWTVTFSGVPGSPASFNFFLPFSGGAAQNLSALAPVSPVVTMAAYMPLSGGTFTGPVAPKVVALTDAATILVSAALGNDFTITLGGNRTMGAPSSPSDGQRITFEVAQDATGTRTLTWAAGAGGYSFGSGAAPVLSTAAGAADQVAFRYSARKGAWLYLGSDGGF